MSSNKRLMECITMAQRAAAQGDTRKCAQWLALAQRVIEKGPDTIMLVPQPDGTWAVIAPDSN